MLGDLYRDAHVGIRARLSELEIRIRDTEAELTDTFWASLEPRVRERLTNLRDALELTREESFEELARAEQLLAAYVEELGRLVASLPTVEEEWRALPDETPDPPTEAQAWCFGWPTREEADGLARSFRAIVRERDPHAEIIEGRTSWLARFRDDGAPFALRATAQTLGNGQIGEVAMCLVTSVRRATPRLLVKHETLVLSFGKALGLKREVEVGEPSFDGLFLVEGEEESALRLLGPSMRAWLLALARFDVPTLEIDPPRRVAGIRWRFQPDPKALDAAVRVLASVRDTEGDVRFRK
jgi:hypothetical protein